MPRPGPKPGSKSAVSTVINEVVSSPAAFRKPKPRGPSNDDDPNRRDLADKLDDIIKDRREREPADPSGPPDPNAVPRGDRTKIQGNRENQRSLNRENESADAMARAGYDVEQNPPGKVNGKNPDYMIEGRYFDCYAPSGDKVNKIRDHISKKVKTGQADSIVLNMDDTKVSPAQLRAYMETHQIPNLKDVKIVQNGQAIDFFPF